MAVAGNGFAGTFGSTGNVLFDTAGGGGGFGFDFAGTFGSTGNVGGFGIAENNVPV